MKKALFGTAVCACLLALTGMASAQLTSIDAIQFYNPLNGAAASPYAGQVVTVQGTLYIVKGTFNSGANYIQNNSVAGSEAGIQVYSSGNPYVLGDEIQVTGTVTTFSGEIEIGTPSGWTLMGHPGEPAPLVKTIPELRGDYENVGSFVRTTGTVATAPTNNNPLTDKSFLITTGGTTAVDTLMVFVSKNTGIDVGAVAVGDVYQVSGASVMYNGTAELKPRKQADLVEGSAPMVQNVHPANYCPGSTDAISIIADITSAIKSITSASVYYRNSAGDSLGAFSSVAMTNVGSTYTGVIPAPHGMRQVDYYISATDNLAQTTKMPASAPAAFYSVAIGLTTIHDIQWAHPDSAYQGSALRTKVCNTQGIVTYGTGEVGAISKFIIEDPAGGPWSGVLVYEPTGGYGTVLPGDKVKVGGRIDEYYGMTEFVPYNGNAVYLLSFGNQLPGPNYVRTRDLSDNSLTDGNGNIGEQWEAVRVRTHAAAVLDSTAGYFIISDTGARVDSVSVNPILPLTYTPVIPDVVIIEGYMDYAGGYRDLRPVRDEDIVSGLSAIGDDKVPAVMPAGGFAAIAPNPFNPKTTIEFVLTRPNLAQLNIYNLRGELVKSLINGRLDTGRYPVIWDGTGNAGQRMASGTYFARLRIGTEVMQVRKLSLVK